MDKLTLIIDRTNTTSAQMDTGTFKYVVPVLQKFYPERLARCVVFPNNTMFWMTWKMCKGWLDIRTQQKVCKYQM
jgi:hypothetical protein